MSSIGSAHRRQLDLQVAPVPGKAGVDHRDALGGVDEVCGDDVVADAVQVRGEFHGVSSIGCVGGRSAWLRYIAMIAYVNSHRRSGGARCPHPTARRWPRSSTRAASILEAGGPSRLTMQAVAERVGVRAAVALQAGAGSRRSAELVAEATVDDLADRLEASDGTLAGARARVPRLRARASRRVPAHVRGRRRRRGDGPGERPVLRVAREIVGPDAALDAARLITAWATGFVEHGAVGLVPLRRRPRPGVRVRAGAARRRGGCALAAP